MPWPLGHPKKDDLEGHATPRNVPGCSRVSSIRGMPHDCHPLRPHRTAALTLILCRYFEGRVPSEPFLE
eukprot:6876243-Prymnesium_polylepis.1